jgi:hypothetical protein
MLGHSAILDPQLHGSALADGEGVSGEMAAGPWPLRADMEAEQEGGIRRIR